MSREPSEVTPSAEERRHLQRTLQSLRDRKQWARAEKLLREVRRRIPEDHWLLGPQGPPRGRALSIKFWTSVADLHPTDHDLAEPIDALAGRPVTAAAVDGSRVAVSGVAVSGIPVGRSRGGARRESPEGECRRHLHL